MSGLTLRASPSALAGSTGAWRRGSRGPSGDVAEEGGGLVVEVVSHHEDVVAAVVGDRLRM
jgi:hypothetical protein